PELWKHTLLYPSGKSNHFISRSASTVHQDQRLSRMNTRAPYLSAFPAATVYHPCSRNLHPIAIYFIIWHMRILLLYYFYLLSLNNRIHEETSGIPLHPGIGQLGFTHGNHHLPYILQCHLTSSLFQFATHISILQIKNRLLT